MTTRKYKKLKGLTKENLRDNMSDLELVLTMFIDYAELMAEDEQLMTEPRQRPKIRYIP